MGEPVVKLNASRVKVLALQVELDDAQQRFEVARDALQAACPHTELCVREGMSYGSYSYSAVCLHCGLFENDRYGVLSGRATKKVETSDEWCQIRDDVFRPLKDAT